MLDDIAARDRKVIEYIWEHLRGRTSDITTFVPRDMVPDLAALIPERPDLSDEHRIMTYLKDMTCRNDGEYQAFEGTKFKATMEPRADWPPGHLGFRLKKL